MSKKAKPTVTAQVEPLIMTVRGERVLLDSALASLYGVTTGRFNEAVKRNIERFPADFAFQLTREEFDILISQNAISSSNPTHSNPTHGGRRKLPWVFTEHGALMAANVLKSERAIEMSVFVIRAFVKLREHTVANATILQRLAEIDQTLLLHDQNLQTLYNAIMPLLLPQEPPTKRRIGFRRDDEDE